MLSWAAHSVLPTVYLTVSSCSPVAAVTVMDIQGEGQFSPFEGKVVETYGVVTTVAPDGEGFFLQDPEGDDDPSTSDAVFVSLEREVRVPAVGVVASPVVEYEMPSQASPEIPDLSEVAQAEIEELVRRAATSANGEIHVRTTVTSGLVVVSVKQEPLLGLGQTIERFLLCRHLHFLSFRGTASAALLSKSTNRAFM